MSTMRTFFRFQ